MGADIPVNVPVLTLNILLVLKQSFKLDFSLPIDKMKFSERNIEESGRKGIEFIIYPESPGSPDFDKDQDKIREIGKILDKCEGSDIVGGYWVTTDKVQTDEKYIKRLKFTLKYPQKTAEG